MQEILINNLGVCAWECACTQTKERKIIYFSHTNEFPLSIKTIQRVKEDPRCHPSVRRWPNIPKDSRWEGKRRGNKEIGSCKSEGETRDGNKYWKKPLLQTSPWDIHLQNKPLSTPIPPSVCLSPSSTHNLTLHWFALQCGRQATTCESNYSYRERLEERKGGRDGDIEQVRGSEEPEIMPSGCVYVKGRK